MESFGEALIALREGAGLTQSTLARHMKFSKAQVNNVEAGRRTPTAAFAKEADKTLDAGGLLIDLAEAERKGDVVRRRAFLSAISTIGGLGVLRQREVGQAIRASMMTALGRDATVDDWQEIAEEYGRAYMTVGAKRLRRELAGDLLMLRQNVVDDEHPALRSAAARMAVIYGMTEASDGDPRGAVRFYRTARNAADLSADRTMRVWTRGREAFTRGYEGCAPETVITIATDAVQLAEDRPSLGLLEAHLAQSHAYSRVGASGPALDAMNAARRIFPHVESDDLGTVYSMPAWRMAMSCSLTLARVGTPTDAERMREEAQQLRPAELVRFGAHLDMHRALVLARTGDPQGIIEALETLSSIPPEQRSLSLRLLASEVLAASGPRETTEARTLLDIVGSLP